MPNYTCARDSLAFQAVPPLAPCLGIRTSAAAAKLYSLSNKASCCVQEEAKAFPFYLANEPVYANEELQVTDKYTKKVAYKVAVASPEDIDR